MQLDQALPRWHQRDRRRRACGSVPRVVTDARERVGRWEAPRYRALRPIRVLERSRLAAAACLLDRFARSRLLGLAREENERVIGVVTPPARRAPLVRLAERALRRLPEIARLRQLKVAIILRCRNGMLATGTEVRSKDVRPRRLFDLYWLLFGGGRTVGRGTLAERARGVGGLRPAQPRRKEPVGSTLQTELLARVLIEERQRELRLVDRCGWQEPSAGKPPPSGPVRKAVATWLMRLGARVAGLTAPPTWKVPEGAGHS